MLWYRVAIVLASFASIITHLAKQSPASLFNFYV